MRHKQRRFLEVITIPETEQLRARLYIEWCVDVPTRWIVIEERRRWRWRFVDALASNVIDYRQARRAAQKRLYSLRDKREERGCG